MGKTLEGKLQEFPPERRQKIDDRVTELIAEELDHTQILSTTGVVVSHDPTR